MAASANIFPDKGGWNGSVLNIPGLLPVDIGSSNPYPVNSWNMQRPQQAQSTALPTGSPDSGISLGLGNISGFGGPGIDGTGVTLGGGIGGSGIGDAQFAAFGNAAANGGTYGQNAPNANGGDYYGPGGVSGTTYPGGFYQGQLNQPGAFPDAPFGYQIQQTPVGGGGGFSQSDLAGLMQTPQLPGQYDTPNFSYQIQPTDMGQYGGLSTSDIISMINGVPHIDPTRDPGFMDWVHAGGNVLGLLGGPLGLANSALNFGQGALNGYNQDTQTTPYLTGIDSIDKMLFGTGSAGALGGALGGLFANNTPQQPSGVDALMQNYGQQQLGGDPTYGFGSGSGGGYSAPASQPDPFAWGLNAPNIGGADLFNSIGMTPWGGGGFGGGGGIGGGWGNYGSIPQGQAGGEVS